MSCSKCGSAPEFISGSCKVYINTVMEGLFGKVTKLISSIWEVSVINHDYLELEVDNFQSFICTLSHLEDLTHKEASAINVLPIHLHETLNFKTYSNTKLLSKWISLLKAGEVVDIINNKHLLTYFQPIIDVKDNSIYGYELLSRGVKKNGMIMPPFEMFHLAAESDLTFNLDRLARETAITNAAKKEITQKLFINFLPSVIYSPEVCLKTTTELIKKYNFKPENITFEVVESEEIKDTDHLMNILTYYREKGFKIALDDLGSGYSSLNNLSKLYPDYIKVDIEIIRDIDTDALKQSIFVALVTMAQGTGIKVLAEGVETKGEFDFVVSKGAHFVQGYYFGKPMPEPVRELEPILLA